MISKTKKQNTKKHIRKNLNKSRKTKKSTSSRPINKSHPTIKRCLAFINDKYPNAKNITIGPKGFSIIHAHLEKDIPNYKDTHKNPSTVGVYFKTTLNRKHNNVVHNWVSMKNGKFSKIGHIAK